MDMNKSSIGILVALCLGAGAGGAYLASRGGSPAPVSELTTQADPAAVEQSEAIVSDPAALDAPASPAAPVPAAAAPRPQARAVARPAAPARSSRPSRESQGATPAAQPTPAERTEARAEPPSLAPARSVESEPPAPIQPPAPQFEDFVVAADSVIGLQLETAVSSEQARVEDQVLGRVTRDVRVGDRVVIPAGSRAEGEVTTVERGGKVRDRARLGIRFTSIVLADGTRVPITTETLYREGDSPGGESTAKIGGGAIGGAIIGGILGGAKGAIIGGSAGAGAGTAVVMAGGRNPASFPAGTPVTVRITQPATVTVEK
jgi:hypothetical protein